MRTFPALLQRALVLGIGLIFRLEYSQVAFPYVFGILLLPSCTISNERITLFFSLPFLQHWTQRAHTGRDKISTWNAPWIHAGLHSQIWGKQEKHPTRRRSGMEQKEEEEECAWDRLMKSPEGADKPVLGIISPLWTIKKASQETAEAVFGYQEGASVRGLFTRICIWDQCSQGNNLLTSGDSVTVNLNMGHFLQEYESWKSLLLHQSVF